MSSPASAFLQARAKTDPDDPRVILACVRRLFENAKRMQHSGVWLSVEEIQAVLDLMPR